MANQEKKPVDGEGASEQESVHHLIDTRLAKMDELGEQVAIYPYAYERTHTSEELRAQRRVCHQPRR